MNLIAIIILSAIIIEFILHFIADVLNLKMLGKSIPDSFKEIYDETKYLKAQEYLKANTIFGWFIGFFNLFIIIVFWFSKGFVILDNAVRSLNFGVIPTGVIYMGILLISKEVISTPFDAYHTFVIEEQYGFNKTTLSTFVFDRIKGLFLSILIGAPILSLILLFFEYTGQNAWWYSWIFISIFIFILQIIVPTFIMPIFNKFEPISEGELKEAIMSYAKSINFPLSNIFIMDGSKRSSKSNAFFTGFGNHKRIVLFDTLVAKHTVNELVAILAHEMAHYKKKHVLKNLLLAILQIGIILFLLSFFISYDKLFQAFYMEQKSIYAGLIFFSMLYSPIDFFISIFIQIYSRKNEYEADNFAVITTKNGKALIEAFKKLSVDNLSNLFPHPLYVFLNYTHPPILARINAISTI
ncbi:MAG: M48 family metallopeptidase [Desulfobacterales bacterium]|nr:M48 family metallopeptidase [Desulfobacterales bacterium]MBF0395902.1 M48 family metallopeptidase [Desulfobacterales bacterium]